MRIVNFYLLTVYVHSYLHPLTLNNEERKNVGGHLSIHLVRIMKMFQAIFLVSRFMYTEKCQCMPNQFPSTKCLIDNWCTLETL